MADFSTITHTYRKHPDLWSEICRGNKQALSEVFLQNYDHLYNYGRKIYNDEHIVEDAIQDVFTTIWQTRERLGTVSSIKAYLIVSLRRRLLRMLEKERAAEPVGMEWQKITPEIRFDVQEVVLGEGDDEVRHQALTEVLNRLPAQKKEVIYLYFYNGMDYEEISLIMNLHIQTVRNYMSMALARAKDIILENELPHSLLLLVTGMILSLTR